MNVYRLLFFLFFTLMITSCKKGGLSDHVSIRPVTFHDVFEQFWLKMNQQYVYWDQEPTDWNAIYIKYSPLFDQLSNSDADIKKSVSYFRQMTNELVDGHYRIVFNSPLIADSIINPGMIKRMKAKGYHDPYNYSTLVRHYLDSGYLEEKGNIIQNGKIISAISGIIDGSALYFSCNFFSLKQSYTSNDGNRLNSVLSYFFSQLNPANKSIKGIIIDLRNNSGGDISDLNFLCGKLINTDAVFGYSRSKSGLGKSNYFPWIEAKIVHDVNYGVTIPIVVLADNFSASLAETVIVALKTRKILFVGEHTYGATGSLSDAGVFNSGSFVIQDFMSVETSSVEFKDRSYRSFENVGIQPDINLPFNYKKISDGVDEQLEEAIYLINK